MIKLGLAVAALAVGGWLAAPWVAMWRHGTLDQQVIRAWREQYEETS